MSQVAEQLVRRQLRVGRTNSFDLERPDSELRRLSEAGVVLALAKGFYALVPEGRRGSETAWRPTIEGAALGIAGAMYQPEAVALIGPSAARVHRCYSRALGSAWVAVPSQRRPRETTLGFVRFAKRDIGNSDTVQVVTDLGSGWATSIEQTVLDLCRNRPVWQISDAARNEMISGLAERVNWDLIEEIAETTRGVKTLRRLQSKLDRLAS